MKPFRERSINGGVQKLYKFDNGYGASVIKHNGSYGHEVDKWELAVLLWRDTNNYDLDYSTDITDDVLGYLDDEAVDVILTRIQLLEKK